MALLSRRAVIGAGAATALAAGAGIAGVSAGVLPSPRRLVGGEEPLRGIPADPDGSVRLERVHSTARDRDVGLFTAVPAGLGAGAGLPVCLVLHGASATTADFQRFGLGRFLTAAVRAGVPPFVLVGADGGRSRWEGDGSSDDPQRMLRDELPRWARERGFDDTRLAAYGWSMGGYGALRWAQVNAGTARAARAVAALSPAIGNGDRVLDDAARLDGRRTALWCGRSDSLLDAVQELAARVPGGPAVASWGAGGHTRNYWNTVTPAAFAFIGRALAMTAPTR